MKGRGELVVFFLALAARALFLLQWRRTPYYLFPQLDDLVHQRWALEILGGSLLGIQSG